MRAILSLFALLLAGCAAPQALPMGAGVACTSFNAVLYGNVTTVYISTDRASGDVIVGPGCLVEIRAKR